MKGGLTPEEIAKTAAMRAKHTLVNALKVLKPMEITMMAKGCRS